MSKDERQDVRDLKLWAVVVEVRLELWAVVVEVRLEIPVAAKTAEDAQAVALDREVFDEELDMARMRASGDEWSAMPRELTKVPGRWKGGVLPWGTSEDLTCEQVLERAKGGES